MNYNIKGTVSDNAADNNINHRFTFQKTEHHLEPEHDAEYMVIVKMAVYNHAKYLRKAIEGVINQKTKYSYRLLIHDDRSTDASVEIIKEYQEKYPEVVIAVLEKENQYSQGKNIWTNCETFLRKAKYIAVCEGDDYWLDEYNIQKKVEFLENNKDYSAVYSNVITIDDEGKPLTNVRTFDMLPDGDYSERDISWYTLNNQSATLVGMNYHYLFSEIQQNIYNGYANKVNGDNALIMVYHHLGKVRHMSDITAAYRRVTEHGTSWNARFNALSWEKQFEFTAKRYMLLTEMQDKLFGYHFKISRTALAYDRVRWFLHFVKKGRINVAYTGLQSKDYLNLEKVNFYYYIAAFARILYDNSGIPERKNRKKQIAGWRKLEKD